MKRNELVCTVCPVSCHLIIIEDENEESGYRVESASCKRGIQYGIKELTNPTRLLTSTVKFVGSNRLRRVPVRTDREIPKDKIKECMKVINSIELREDVKAGEILLENVCNTEANIIASRSVSVK